MDPAEHRLLARLKSGDAQAFETIFAEYYARLCGFAYGYLHSPEDAEETVQTVLLALWERRAELSLHSSLKAYLFASVRNHALNRSARARLEQRWYDDHVHDPAAAADSSELTAAEAAVESAQVAERVRAAIEALPPGARRVLMLRWEQQMSYAEIAEALQISIKGVENQLARAKQALRARLGDVLRG